MKTTIRVIVIIASVLALTFVLSRLTGPSETAPAQTAICEGHGSVVEQESVNDYRSPGFTGHAVCSDGRSEWWIDGMLDQAS